MEDEHDIVTHNAFCRDCIYKRRKIKVEKEGIPRKIFRSGEFGLCPRLANIIINSR